MIAELIFAGSCSTSCVRVKTAFAFDQAYNGMLVPFAHLCVAPLVPQSPSAFNMSGAFRNLAMTNDYPLFLVCQHSVCRVSSGILNDDKNRDQRTGCINTLVDSLMAQHSLLRCLLRMRCWLSSSSLNAQNSGVIFGRLRDPANLWRLNSCAYFVRQHLRPDFLDISRQIVDLGRRSLFAMVEGREPAIFSSYIY